MIDKIILKMITYFQTDARRINHALKVYGFASTISAQEKMSEDEQLIVGCVAILHDIGIHVAEQKYQSTSGHYQEIEGPAIARQILVECGAKRELIDRVCHIIGLHHHYERIDGKDFQVLVEADCLVNIFEDNTSVDAMERLRSHVFKTTTGIHILDTVYLTR